jgi:DnaJ-class molecular chaperone
MSCPYAVLGLEKNASIINVKNAYKQKVLLCHPDKPGGTIEEFQKVQDAYERITKTQCQTQWCQTIIEMFSMFAQSITPKIVSIYLNVDFHDVYHKKIKRLVIKVKRWNNQIFDVSFNQIVYLSLDKLNQIYIFDTLGDDCMFNNKRSDLIIHTQIVNVPECISIGTVFGTYDLYVNIPCTLYEYYTMDKFDIADVFKIENKHTKSFCLLDLGMPQGDGQRGNIYVRLDICLPEIPENHEESFIKCLKQHFA